MEHWVIVELYGGIVESVRVFHDKFAAQNIYEQLWIDLLKVKDFGGYPSLEEAVEDYKANAEGDETDYTLFEVVK